MAERSLTIVTWNLYLGGDIARIVGAGPADTAQATADLWAMVQRTDFQTRAEALAGELARVSPDIIALQEAFRWSVSDQSPPQPGPLDDHVVYDFTVLLENALARRGLHYFVVSRHAGLDAVLPMVGGKQLRFEDSLVLLLRRDAGPSPLVWQNRRSGRFAAALRVPIAGEPFDIERGWTSVDLRHGDSRLRVLTTHLEYLDARVRDAQLRELLEVPGAISDPLILLGDFNCRPDEDMWSGLRAQGFEDAWSATKQEPGFTSGFAEPLDDAAPHLTERIDWIMCRGGIEPVSSHLLGDQPTSRTAGGLWPSDHAGIAASLIVRWP